MADLLDFTKPHVLRTEDEYDAAIVEIEALLDLDPVACSDDWERLRFLSVLAEAYEREHYPTPAGTPQEVVDFMLEQKGLHRSDLHEPMGGKSRVSEFFHGKRPLSRSQIEALRGLLGIPADLLL